MVEMWLSRLQIYGPSNAAGLDFFLDYYSEGGDLVEAITRFFNDAGATSHGESVRLISPSDSDINQTINDSGVFGLGAQLFPKLYALNESRSGNNRGDGDGKMDFVTQQVTINGKKQAISDNNFYTTTTASGSYAHNSYNYGNFLWGAATKALGIGDRMVRYGANRDAKKHTGKPDSPDDQRSIFLGREQKTSKIKQ